MNMDISVNKQTRAKLVAGFSRLLADKVAGEQTTWILCRSLEQ